MANQSGIVLPMPLPAIALLLLSSMQNTAEIPVIDRGSTLFHDCKASIRTQDSGDTSLRAYADGAMCIGYVDGFTDGLNFLKVNFCLTGATVGTMVSIYLAYMERTPRSWTNRRALDRPSPWLKLTPAQRNRMAITTRSVK